MAASVEEVRGAARAGVALAFVGLGFLSVVGGTLSLLVFVSVVLALSYLELRRILAPGTSRTSLIVGVAATVSLAVLASRGETGALPWAVGALVVALFVLRIAGVELGWADIAGTTNDVGATVTAVGLVGVLGAHVLLVRAVPVVGFEAALAFAIVLTAQGVGGAAGRLAGGGPVAEDLDPSITWGAVLGGIAAAAVGGLIVGIVLDPPFSLRWGATLGAAVGGVVPIARTAVGAVKRGAGLAPRAGYLPGLGGTLDLAAGSLLAAPVFYWLLRGTVV